MPSDLAFYYFSELLPFSTAPPEDMPCLPGVQRCMARVAISGQRCLLRAHHFAIFIRPDHADDGQSYKLCRTHKELLSLHEVGRPNRMSHSQGSADRSLLQTIRQGSTESSSQRRYHVNQSGTGPSQQPTQAAPYHLLEGEGQRRNALLKKLLTNVRVQSPNVQPNADHCLYSALSFRTGLNWSNSSSLP